jgi:hypothetical protein
MSVPTKVIVDCSTGTESIVELTAGEIAQMATDAAAFAVRVIAVFVVTTDTV